MSPSLRKRHRLIWWVLALLLPLLFIGAILVIPKPAHQDTLYQAPNTTQTPEPPKPYKP